MTRAFRLALVLGLAFPSIALAQQAASQRVMGDVTAMDGQTMTIKPPEGPASTIKLAPDYAVATISKGSIADLGPNNFVGVGAKPQPDGTQRAVQIVIFPEAMRGAGEGHRAWGALPESTMTNATIEDTVQSINAGTMTLKYKGGSQKVTIPSDATILKLGMGDKAMLKVGSRATVTATSAADGTLSASRATVLLDGVSLM